jgi:tripartite ATP-independent transporter DctP family solute receptor
MNRLVLGLGITLATSLIASIGYATTLRLSHHHSVGSAVDITAKRFSALVEEKTEGRIDIRVFPGGQLGQELEAFDLLNQGGLDLTVTAISQMDQVYPPMAITSLPFVFRDWEHATTALNGEFGKSLAAGISDKSQTEILAYFGLGFRDMLFVGEPARTVDAMDGLRMRSPENFIWIAMFENLGARPTPITWGEVYTAMQTGVADGLDSPPAAALDMKFNEVTSSLVRTHHMFSAMALAMNEVALRKLSAADQELIKQAAKEAATWADREVGLPNELAAYEKLEANGVAVHDPVEIKKWRAAVAPVWKTVTDRDDGSEQLIEMLVKQ